MVRIGSVVDILFNDRGTFKPYEGVIIDILTSNPTDIGIIYYVSFSDGDFKVYTEKKLDSLILKCKKWKEKNPNHTRGDPSSWKNKHTSQKEDGEILNKILNSIQIKK